MNIDLTIEETRQPVPNFTVATAMEKLEKQKTHGIRKIQN